MKAVRLNRFVVFCHLFQLPRVGPLLSVDGTHSCNVLTVSNRRLSVCLSVTSRCSTETAKRRITQATPHDSTGTLVFWCLKSRQNSNCDGWITGIKHRAFRFSPKQRKKKRKPRKTD